MRFSYRICLIFVSCVFYFSLKLNYSDHQISKSENSTIPIVIPPECVCKSRKTGKLFDFCYRLPENVSRKGKKMSCEWVEAWEAIEGSPKWKLIDLRTEKAPDPVFVTAFNDPFFQNGLRLISSIRKLGYRQKIVLYDLGIEPEKLAEFMKKACNVEVRHFNFTAYPSYMKNLREYRWKPIVIAESLRDFGAIWYLDSSLIFQKADVSHVYQLLSCQRQQQLGLEAISRIYSNPFRPPMLSDTERDLRESTQEHESGWDKQVYEKNLKECQKSQYLLHGFTGHGIWSATNPGVYTYFPTNLTLIKKKKAKMYDANLIYAVNTQETAMEIVKWTFLCALEEECMAPKGSTLGCRFGNDRFEPYAGCHRYDQSIMNLLLANRYWYDRHFYVSEIVDFFQINRGSSGFEEHFGCA